MGEEGEERERVVKMAGVSPLYCGKQKSKRYIKRVQDVNNSYDSVIFSMKCYQGRDTEERRMFQK